MRRRGTGREDGCKRGQCGRTVMGSPWGRGCRWLQHLQLFALRRSEPCRARQVTEMLLVLSGERKVDTVQEGQPSVTWPLAP